MKEFKMLALGVVLFIVGIFIVETSQQAVSKSHIKVAPETMLDYPNAKNVREAYNQCLARSERNREDDLTRSEKCSELHKYATDLVSQRAERIKASAENLSNDATRPSQSTTSPEEAYRAAWNKLSACFFESIADSEPALTSVATCARAGIDWCNSHVDKSVWKTSSDVKILPVSGRIQIDNAVCADGLSSMYRVSFSVYQQELENYLHFEGTGLYKPIQFDIRPYVEPH